MQRFSPRGEGSESHIRFPSPAVLHQEDENPECLALKVSGAYFGDSQSTVGNRDSSFKGHTLWDLSADQTHLLILENFLERQEATGAYPGTQTLVSVDTGADKWQFGILPLALQFQGT